jgi:hypothetical protein
MNFIHVTFAAISFFASRGPSHLHPSRREREERGRRKGSIEEGRSVEGQTATTT